MHNRQNRGDLHRKGGQIRPTSSRTSTSPRRECCARCVSQGDFFAENGAVSYLDRVKLLQPPNLLKILPARRQVHRPSAGAVRWRELGCRWRPRRRGRRGSQAVCQHQRKKKSESPAKAPMHMDRFMEDSSTFLQRKIQICSSIGRFKCVPPTEDSNMFLDDKARFRTHLFHRRRAAKIRRIDP